MKKIKYFIFSIALLFVFLIQSNKQVKALEEQTFPEILVKVPYYSANFEQSNTFTYEFIIRYKLNNIFIDNLNDNDYFLVTIKGFGVGLVKGINRNASTYELEEIQIEDNSTVFFVRFTLSKTIVDNQYGGIDYLLDFFLYHSAFYIYYDIYTDAYNEGYDVGYSEGMDRGYGDGYIDGYNDGYDTGYNNGLNDNQGYNLGYNKGLTDGFNNGYDEGHWEGYNSGYSNGYNIGLNDGYNTGLTNGYNQGYDEGFLNGYDEGYNYGYNVGVNEQLEDKDFTHLLKSVFIGIGSFLGINLLPGISIGAIIAVPIIFGIIAFILGRRKD